MDKMQQRLLYFSPSPRGGLADYAHEQAEALTRRGVEVRLLTAQAYCKQGTYQLGQRLPGADNSRGPRTWRRIRCALDIVRTHRFLASAVREGGYGHVLLGSYAEYMAPLWAGPLVRAARRGIVFGAIIHDPVRDYVLGPRWWHRRSVAAAYSYLREAFVHEDIALDTARPMPQLRTTVIPHGPYRFPPARRTVADTRSLWKIRKEDKVLLSFGHIRDGKNLDLALRAMVDFDDVYLVVAGKVSAASQRPVKHYQTLARQLGIADRCRWLVDYIPQEDVADLFEAADGILLTYSVAFRSASGVLNTAVAYRRPCIASSGPGNLRTVVGRYRLGVFVEPDDYLNIRQGIARWRAGLPQPLWDEYERDNSWDRNAEIVCTRLWNAKT